MYLFINVEIGHVLRRRKRDKRARCTSGVIESCNRWIGLIVTLTPTSRVNASVKCRLTWLTFYSAILTDNWRVTLNVPSVMLAFNIPNKPCTCSSGLLLLCPDSNCIFILGFKSGFAYLRVIRRVNFLQRTRFKFKLFVSWLNNFICCCIQSEIKSEK